MKIICIAIGTLSHPHWKAAHTFYIGRLPHVSLKEIDIKTSEDAAYQKKKEGELIQAALKSIPGSPYLVALDETGDLLSSDQFAEWMGNLTLVHPGPIVFLIGGSWGLSSLIKKQCHKILSFSRMTWPHQMARIMLWEQLYRAQMILKGHPYHK